MADTRVVPRRFHRWLPWIGALLGIGTLVWLLRRFDLDRFVAVLAAADARYLAITLLAVIAEQVVRAWKWRQLLYRLRPIGIGRLPAEFAASVTHPPRSQQYTGSD